MWLAHLRADFSKGDLMSEPNKDIGAKDDPRSAPESGEQKESGRNRGQVVDPQANREVKDRSDGTGEEFGEGRHEATPRTGG
jgi:hypothetical protein